MPEVFFGGARGGGKTDGVLGKYALKAAVYGDGFNALFCRRELPMLDDAIERSKEIFGPLGARWLDQKKTWHFPNGGRLRFRPLERVDDAGKYQGQNISDACIEEAGLYPDPRPIDRLQGVLRSAKGVPTQLILTGNPGGAGQGWIKARYIDPWPDGMKILRRPLPNGGEHRYVFIPSRIRDNRLLMARDPGYVNRLHLVGSAELVRAWLEGDWNAVEGAFFDCWSTERHVIRPFTIPTDWLRFRSMDWGSAAPFSVGWWAVASDDCTPDATGGGTIPRGALVRYREWYGASSPGVGLKLTAEEVAAGIKSREAGDQITYGVLDPSAFAQDGGPSIAERLARAGVLFRPADNKRVTVRGAMGGWDQMRARLKGDGERPALFVFSTCTDFIRTVPVLQHDPDKPEDLDTESEDHCFAAETLVETSEGPKPIGSLVGTEGLVFSYHGHVNFHSCRLTRRNAEVIRLTFSNGRSVVCTPDHLFMTIKGWVRALELLDASGYICMIEAKDHAWTRPSSLAQSKNSMASVIISAAATFRRMAKDFTVPSGSITTARSLMASTSITSTTIAPTIGSQIWHSSRSLNTLVVRMARQALFALCSTCQRRVRLLGSGMVQKKGSRGTSPITRLSLIAFIVGSRRFVSSARSRLKGWRADPAFAAMPARPHGGAHLASMISTALARSVSRSSGSTSTPNSTPVRPNVAPRPAPTGGVTCLRIEPAGRADVYCLTVPDGAAFVIEGGFLVHNCGDEARYACMSRPYARVVPPARSPVFDYRGEDGRIVSGVPIGEMIRRQTQRRERE